VHFDHEVGRILQAAGVARAIAPTTEPADLYEWRNASGQTLLRFASRPSGRSGWPEASMFAQPELERLLDARVRALTTVELHRAHEVVGIETSAADVKLTIAAAGRGRRECRARYVIGCDGANSFVRPHLGATVTDLGFFFDWLIVDVLPREPRTWQPLNLQICDPARPTTLVSGGRGRRRWEFMRLPDESIEELNSVESAWRLLAPWGVAPDNAELERHAVYRFQARWVDRWRSGRLLLAGDAAHQMPPFAGQGMCSGLRDAMNLAWKLDLVLARKAPGELLDTYASERVPHVRALIEFSMELGKVICMTDPAQVAARDQVMVAAAAQAELVTQPPSLSIGPGLGIEGDPRAGELFVQGRVRLGDATGLFDDVVGRGFALLSPAANPLALLDTASSALFAHFGGVAARVSADGPVVDVDGTYARWFEGAGVAAVLQRPDFYVFGTAPTLADVPQLIAALERELTGTRRLPPAPGPPRG